MSAEGQYNKASGYRSNDAVCNLGDGAHIAFREVFTNIKNENDIKCLECSISFDIMFKSSKSSEEYLFGNACICMSGNIENGAMKKPAGVCVNRGQSCTCECSHNGNVHTNLSIRKDVPEEIKNEISDYVLNYEIVSMDVSSNSEIAIDLDTEILLYMMMTYDEFISSCINSALSNRPYTTVCMGTPSSIDSSVVRKRG